MCDSSCCNYIDDLAVLLNKGMQVDIANTLPNLAKAFNMIPYHTLDLFTNGMNLIS